MPAVRLTTCGKFIAPCRLPRRMAVRAAARSARFATLLRSRHEPVNREAVATARELRRERESGLELTQHHWHSSWSPRIALSLSWLTGRNAPSAVAAGLPPDTAHGAESLRYIIASVVPSAARFARIDGLSASPVVRSAALMSAEGSRRLGATATSSPMATVESAPVRTLARVLRRPVLSATVAPMTKPEDSTPAPVLFDSPIGRQAMAAAGRANSQMLSAAIDVEGLADRVVRVIDRRLVALRERHGRL